MKFSKLFIILLLLLFIFENAFSQVGKRRNQIELYGGLALPMSPDEFKDYYKTGLSLHGQYVIFPSPKLGISFGAGYEIFTVDNEAIKEDFLGFYTNYDISVEGNANVTEVSIGVRPYLSSPESNMQFFLFGMGTYNFLKTEINIKYSGIEYDYITGTYFNVEEEEDFKDDDDKLGIAIGAGIETPMGESMNLIFQGLYRFIFTEDETTNFLGITAGVIF